MAQPWLHYGCSEEVPRRLQAEASSRGGRINLAETLQLSSVEIAFDPLQRMDESIQISLGKLTVLLPLHGAGVGSQRWRCEI